MLAPCAEQRGAGGFWMLELGLGYRTGLGAELELAEALERSWRQ